MPLVLRTSNPGALTNDQLDGNFTFLNGLIEGLRGEVDTIADTTIPALSSSTTSSLSGKQPLNAKLTSLSGLSTSGLAAVVDNTIVPRTLAAGSSHLTVTNGNGVSGNPTVDIASTVVTTTATQTLSGKSISGNNNTISSVSLTSSVIGILPVANGGTNADTAAGARTQLNALVSPSGTGFVVRTGADATLTRQLAVVGSGLSLDFPNGILGNPTITLNSASSNTANSVVIRDSVGSFSANTITATLVGNVVGNAATVTNGIYNNQQYNNPDWLASLAGTKVTSIPNSSLQNSSFTLNGNVVPLGGSIVFPTDIQPRSTANIGSTIVLRDPAGNFAANVISATLNGNVNGNINGNVVGSVNGNVTGNVIGNVTGSASLNILRSGDGMTGPLSVQYPSQPAHAASKQYVDNNIVRYTFTSGASPTVSYTNIVGQWNDANYFDVFPPAGKSMGNLLAFIPSIHAIWFAGNVNGDDALRCTYSYYGDRIRVFVQNTEQRQRPYANWLAIWS